MNTKNRVGWIDISKGIAIILVVLGHSIQSYGDDSDVLFKCIYSFHMPVFFVVSGLTFKWTGDFKTHIKKKAKTLLLPYAGFVVITFFYNSFVALLKGNIDAVTDRIVERLIRTLLVTSDSYFINLWFLPCLFLSLLLAHIVFNKFDKNIVRGGVFVVFSITAYILRSRFGFVFPLCGEVAVVATVWIFVGYKLMDIYQKGKVNIRLAAFISLILIGALNYISDIVSPGISDSYRQLLFGNILVSFATGLTGSLLVISASMLIRRNVVLENIGKNSLWIYGLHFLLLGFLGTVMKRVLLVKNYSLLRVSIGTVVNVGLIMFFLLLYGFIKKNFKFEKEK